MRSGVDRNVLNLANTWKRFAAYIIDARSDPLQGTRMVNWNVVGEKVSELTVDIRRLWRDFTREITGPP